MIEKAIEKLKEEMIKDNTTYVQVVGQFLLTHLERFPSDAEKFLDSEKTISKSLTAMRKEAEKQKVGNCAVLTDQEGFAVVLKYFNIKEDLNLSEIPIIEQVKPVTKAIVDFDVDLENYFD